VLDEALLLHHDLQVDIFGIGANNLRSRGGTDGAERCA